MASSSSKNGNDLLQIVMMTFYLMAIFFAAWGGYNQYKCHRLLQARSHEVSSFNQLQKLMSSSKNEQAVRDWRRREDSREHSRDVNASVREVLEHLGSNAPEIDHIRERGAKSFGKGVVEQEYDVEFLDTSLRKLVAFVYQLEAEQPHINFKSIRFNRRSSKKNKQEDSWKSVLKMATYSSRGE